MARLIEKIVKTAAKEKTVDPSRAGRVSRGLSTGKATLLGAELGGAAGGVTGYGAGRLAQKIRGKAKGRLGIGLTIGGALAGALAGGGKAYQMARYKPGETEKKYRGMVGLQLGGPVGAVIGARGAREGVRVGKKK